MRRLLVINPNTSSAVSDLVQDHVQRTAGHGIQVETVTARFGAPYISCEASYAVAGHALLDAWAAYQFNNPGLNPTAVLIACFGDPGLWGLRECCGVPVTGLAEASFVQAARHGPFAIVTGGSKWKPILQRLAMGLGFSDQLLAIHTVAPSGAELANDPQAAISLLTQACQHAAADPQVRSIVLGGAGLAGLASTIQAAVPVPVIDSVIAGTQHALVMTTPLPVMTRKKVQWQNVSQELCALGEI